MFSTNTLEKFALPLSESLSYALVASSVVQACCSVFSIAGNIIVLIVYYETPRLRSKVSSLFIINLAISDLAIGLLVLPLMITTNIFILCDQVLFLRAVLESIAVPILSSVSLWTVLGASVDRFVAIRYPHQYVTMVTRTRISRAIFFSWVYSSTWIWFPFLPDLIGKYFVMVRSFIGFLIAMTVIFCWTVVYLQLRKRRRIAIPGNQNVMRPNHKMWYSVERKVAKTFFCACVTVILYTCFVPLWIRAIGHFFGALDNYAYGVYAITLILSNSAINPFIYSFTSRIFRGALLGRNQQRSALLS